MGVFILFAVNFFFSAWQKTVAENSRHRPAVFIFKKVMALQFGFAWKIASQYFTSYEAKRTSCKNVTTHQTVKSIKFSLTARL